MNKLRSKLALKIHGVADERLAVPDHNELLILSAEDL